MVVNILERLIYEQQNKIKAEQNISNIYNISNNYPNNWNSVDSSERLADGNCGSNDHGLC